MSLSAMAITVTVGKDSFVDKASFAARCKKKIHSTSAFHAT